MKRVGFIGLGNIGRGICSNLIKQGNEMTVYDVYRPAMEKFEGQAYLAADPVEVLRRSDYVFLSLPKSEVVEDTVHSFIKEGVQGKMIIDTSTSYPISTKKLYEELKAAGGALVDAPLMAGPDEAAAGTLDIVVGGDKEDYDKATELFDAYCQSYKYLFDVFEDSVLKNWTSTFYTKKYMDRNYRLDFALALGTKDLSYVTRMYEEYNVPAFVLDGALDFCRVALAEQEKGQPPIDMSYPCETMYRLLGMK